MNQLQTDKLKLFLEKITAEYNLGGRIRVGINFVNNKYFTVFI